MSVDQCEVNQANFAGRLHPSQRRRVLENFLVGLFLLAAGAYVSGLLLSNTLASRGQGFDPWRGFWISAVPMSLLMFSGLWIAGRRLGEVLMGRVIAVAGPAEVRTHSKVATVSWNMAPKNLKRAPRYLIKIGDRWYEANRSLYVLAVPGRRNVGFLTPWTKRLVNVVPQDA